MERSGFPANFSGRWHDHRDAQLIYPSAGTMAIETQEGLWIVPPQQACWLPGGQAHRVRTSRGFEMYSVYCTGALAQGMPKVGGIVSVTGLLRETIFALSSGPAGRRYRALVALFAEEVTVGGPPALRLPQLRSRHLRRIEARLADHPACSWTLARWAEELGTTTRSLARSFRREACTTFTAYRRVARLCAALLQMADGAPLTAVALDLSFGSASNFIRSFRQATGMTPRQYLAALAPRAD